jgi:hypothetical protein
MSEQNVMVKAARRAKSALRKAFPGTKVPIGAPQPRLRPPARGRDQAALRRVDSAPRRRDRAQRLLESPPLADNVVSLPLAKHT